MTPTLTMPEAATSVVYFVEIGPHIKIGVTTNLASRLKTFETSSTSVRLLLSIPGDRTLERRLHELLDESRIAREIFRREYRVFGFIDVAKEYGVERALRYLDESTPAARSRFKIEERERRTVEARKSKAEKDAYFASLVTQRKQRLGW